MKQATLGKLQRAARKNAVRLLYLDEAGFPASLPVQRSWSPRCLTGQWQLTAIGKTSSMKKRIKPQAKSNA